MQARRIPRPPAAPGVLLAEGLPMPAPPWASETVMQCSVLTEYKTVAMGLARFPASVSAARGSRMKTVRRGRARGWMPSSTASGSTWS